MGKDIIQNLDELLVGFENENDSDVLVFNGPIRPETSRSFRQRMNQKNTGRKNVLLMLSTLGGSPDDGYRIARALQRRYEQFTIYIPSLCKSTGTLLAIGASEVVMGDFGELGPLDIQIRKVDEIWESSSGLNVSAALAQIETRVCESFSRFFFEMKRNFQLSTKTASEIATKLSEGIYEGIAEQIDPIQLGETHRSIGIAQHYGESLNNKGKNLKDGALERLIAGYPSHGYVIDSEEASSLFNKVRSPTEKEVKLFNALDAFFNLSIVVDQAQDSVIWNVRDLIDFFIERKKQEEAQAARLRENEDEQQEATTGTPSNPASKQSKNGGLREQVESNVQSNQPKESANRAASAKRNEVPRDIGSASSKPS